MPVQLRTPAKQFLGGESADGLIVIVLLKASDRPNRSQMLREQAECFRFFVTLSIVPEPDAEWLHDPSNNSQT